MTPEVLAAVMEATWPPFALRDLGPWRLRDGAGGGKRVSATTAERAWGEADLDAGGGLFLIREGDGALDAALAGMGFRIVDPVLAYAARLSAFAAPARMTGFAHWPPLEIAKALWAEAGIGPARLAVMDRVTGAKTVILGRQADRVAGVAFVALHGRQAMLHTLEVAPAFRRQGCGGHILRSAAHWAQDQGADTLSLVVTEANAAARGLYASLGMQVVGQYHYREK